MSGIGGSAAVDTNQFNGTLADLVAFVDGTGGGSDGGSGGSDGGSGGTGGSGGGGSGGGGGSSGDVDGSSGSDDMGKADSPSPPNPAMPGKGGCALAGADRATAAPWWLLAIGLMLACVRRTRRT